MARQRALAEATGQLREESARRSRISAEATDRERELGARVAELEQASRKAAGDLAARARASAEEATAKDQQIATIEQARREAEARVAALSKQAQTLTAQAGDGIASPVAPLRRSPLPTLPRQRGRVGRGRVRKWPRSIRTRRLP
jgi:predicted oxidoreductase